jgi:hypothetical protein
MEQSNTYYLEEAPIHKAVANKIAAVMLAY